MWQHVFLQAVKRTIDLIGHGDQEHIHKQNVILLLIQLAIKERRGKGVEPEKKERKQPCNRQKYILYSLDCVSQPYREVPLLLGNKSDSASRV